MKKYRERKYRSRQPMLASITDLLLKEKKVPKGMGRPVLG
jgi:hypothetical protein